MFRLGLMNGPGASGRSLGTAHYWGVKMKTVFAALALLIGVAACDTRRGQDTGRVGEAADTGVMTTGTQDTAGFGRDTTMQADTGAHAGDTAISH